MQKGPLCLRRQLSGVALLVVLAHVVSTARVTFLPGAVTAAGEVDFAAYDVASPLHGFQRRNATRLEVRSASTGYYAAPRVDLDPIRVYPVDHFGISVWRGLSMTIAMTLVDFPEKSSEYTKTAAPIIAPVSALLPAGATYVEFSSITLSCPTVGKYVLHFRAYGSNRTRRDAQGVLEFAVLQHYVPESLNLVRHPSPFSNDYTPFSQQPILRIADACGNTVTDPRAQGNVAALVLALDRSTLQHVASVSGGLVTVRDGLVVFTDLHVRSKNRFGPYLLEFVFEAPDDPEGVRRLVQQVSITASYCNVSALSPIVHSYPDRFYSYTSAPSASVVLRGGVFSFFMSEHFRCMFEGVGVVRAQLIDECNINCSLPAPFPVGVVPLSLSLDRGVTFSMATRVIFLTVDFALRLRFDNPEIEATNIVVLDPLGNTNVGNISVYVVDQLGNDVWNFTSQSYAVTLSSPTLSISGSLTGTAHNGYVQLANIVWRSFPATRDYTLYVAGEDKLTGQSLFGSRTVSALYARDVCVPPPHVTLVVTRACYGNGAGIALTSCGSEETHSLTVYGTYFGLSGAAVYIGGVRCAETRHDAVNVGSQLNCRCFFPPYDSNITVVTSSTQLYTSPAPLLWMAQPVNVSHVVGCPRNVFPSTGGCSTSSSTRVTIFGSNFGVANASVFLNHIFTSITIRCTNVSHAEGDPTRQLSCSIPVALGFGLVVTVRNAQTGQLGRPANQASISYVASTGVLCQTDSDGFFCSQRGTCFLQNGTCNCVHSQAAGFWRGEFCQTCVDGYFGSSCTTPCPSCSATSRCDDGVTGSGLCVCTYGWGGTLCNIPCPGGASTPCGGHGTCNADLTCTCQSSPDTGFWDGATCLLCGEGWSGPLCKTPCPRFNNRVCNGHGACQDGTCKCAQNYCDSACNVSFAGCSGCVPGAYGKDCSKACPGGVDNVCFGNGFCSDGPFGNGLCTCYEGWGGANCTTTCPHGPANLCSGHGTCDVERGVCTCDVGFTLGDCGTPCPGGADNPCNGNGECNVTTSTCKCSTGWSGTACNITCPGGVETPCNLHGTCVQATSRCECFADSARGYWAGATCTECDSEWWGPQCRQQCPFAYDVQCGGHGQCGHDVVCRCFQSMTTGFWSGKDCAECAFGYYGATCVSECPGSSCNPCYSRGNCSQGVNGTGLCSCDADTTLGFWSGIVCDACAPDWYGENCTNPCPRGLQNLTCSARGTCSDGRLGSGMCTCSGNFGGPVCQQCAVGFYGAGCSRQCPGPLGKPCLLRGQCENTETSSGNCTCDAGYGGSTCQFVCPAGPYGVCNMQGECVLNPQATEMVCIHCASSAVTGFWTGFSCSDCLPGYYGSLCKNTCPGGASTPCNNRGTCSDGYAGSGSCTCTFGYAGLSCEKTCVGGALLPCSAHGVCDAVTGECACFSDNRSGFWNGAACDACDAMYASSTCTVACPTSVPGVACSGHGTCFQGVCLTCASGFCGATCASSVGCVNCPSGTYGSNCTDCPGGRFTPCSNQGTCLQGVNGNGQCICSFGYKGSNCSVKCPGPAGVPCYGRGTCTDDGTCLCSANWAGADCNMPCNGFDQRLANSSSCSSVGTCDKKDGSCHCFYGYGGSYCQIKCPGTSGPCNNRGMCLAENGTCSCYTNTTIGFWNGPSCSYCQPGYYDASSCSKKCANGVSDATFTQCVCDPYWSGEGCSKPCPGLLDGSICYGHGTCLWGRDTLGKCVCDATWYDPNCLTFCTKAGCDSVLINGQCNVDTGVCECQFDAAGHWDYTTAAQLTCEVCDVFYFGENCESPCACSKHGTCDRRTGACSCYADPVRGHWGGSSCSTCAAGYIGVRCQNLNVAISPLGTVAAVATVPALDVMMGIVCRDPLYPFQYIGTSPVAVTSPTDRLLSTLQLGGFALRCVYRSQRELYIVTYSQARLMLNVIGRQNGEYLRTEYLPIPPEVRGSARMFDPLAFRSERRLMQFEPTNASTLNGAIMAASSIMPPFTGETEDVIITPYGAGVVQYYQISSGTQVVVATNFTRIVDAVPVDGIDGVYCISGLVANGTSNRWEVVWVDNAWPTGVPPTLRQLASFYNAFGPPMAAQCPGCTPSRVFGTAEFVVMIFASSGVGMYLARMDIAHSDAEYGVVDRGEITLQYFYGSVCTVTATAIDSYASTGYFAMSCGSSPSVIMKFELATCLVTGIIQLSIVGADTETVVALSIIHELRMLAALTPLSRSQRVQKVSLFAVSGVTPRIADTKGGTRITVTGEGFVAGMACIFNGDATIAADFVNLRTLVCTAPPGGTVACAGEPVEVSLPGSGTTNNGQLLQRVASAAIRQVVNQETGENSGFLHGSHITVYGSGFVLPSNASLLLCKLFSPAVDSPFDVVVQATFVSSYEVTCSLPPLSVPLPKPSYLEVSIDGTVFSDSRAEFDVLGEASSLFISEPISGALMVRASSKTALPSVFVNIADSVAHPLRHYVNRSHHITVSLPPESQFELFGTLDVEVENGLALFSDVAIVNPTVGIVQLVFTDTLAGWVALLSFTVAEGEPYRMYFERRPSTTVTNDVSTLSEQPIVGIVDSSGNALSTLDDKAVRVELIQLTYSIHDTDDVLQTRHQSITQLNGKFRVEGVSITGKHQEAYFLYFTAKELNVTTLVSDPIVVGWCRPEAFAIRNSTACRSCPANGKCDGTFDIEAQDGWWRADNTTLQFYSCSSPFSGDSCFNNSRCVEGYRGPRCSLCDVGYGRSGRYCLKCQTSTANTAIVLVACTALLCVITLLVFSIVMTSSHDLLPVLFRNVVTFIQILARLSDTLMPWPSLLDEIWRTVGSIANLQAIDFSPFDCAMQTDFFHKYIYTLIIPWVMILLVAPMAIAVVRLFAREETLTLEALEVAARCREEEDGAILREIRLATAQRRATMIGEVSRRRHMPGNPLTDIDVDKPMIANVLNDKALVELVEKDAKERSSEWTLDALTKNRVEHVRHILSIRRARYLPTAVLVVTAVTVFTLLYPTLVQSSGQVLQCESMDLGREGVQLISTNQRDVRCTSPYYNTFYTLSISMIMIYGVSIPLGLIAVVEVLKRLGGMSLARAILAFTMAGFKPELWFWESVNLMRKFMAMFVVVFVKDAKLQMIVFMWVMVVGFVLNVTFVPYTSQLVYRLESLAMASTVVTMNLVLMFFFFVGSDGGYRDWRVVAISVAIIAINAVTLVAYCYAIGLHFALRVRRWREATTSAAQLGDALQQRVRNIVQFAQEVHGIRVRRAELDQAIERIEEKLDEVLDRHGGFLDSWQFPTDGTEEEGSAHTEESSEEEQQEEEEVPTNEKRPTVSFSAQQDVVTVAPRLRKSVKKVQMVRKMGFKDFTVARHHELLKQQPNGDLWVHEPQAKKEADSKKLDKSLFMFDTRELLAALGDHGDATELGLDNLGGAAEDDEQRRNPKTRRMSVGLTADLLRRLHTEEAEETDDAVPRDATAAAAPFRMYDDTAALAAHVGDEDNALFPVPVDHKALLDSSDSDVDEIAARAKRLRPLTRQAVVDRVTSWHEGIQPDGASPQASSLTFEHHYLRDEEAEVDFLEGRATSLPPQVHSVLQAVPVFDPSAELVKLSGRIAEDFETSVLDDQFVLPLEKPTPLSLATANADGSAPTTRRVTAAWTNPSLSTPPQVGLFSRSLNEAATFAQDLPRAAVRVCDSLLVAEQSPVQPFSRRRGIADSPTASRHKKLESKDTLLLLGAGYSSSSDDNADAYVAPMPILQTFRYDSAEVAVGQKAPVDRTGQDTDLGLDFAEAMGADDYLSTTFAFLPPTSGPAKPSAESPRGWLSVRASLSNLRPKRGAADSSELASAGASAEAAATPLPPVSALTPADEAERHPHIEPDDRSRSNLADASETSQPTTPVDSRLERSRRQAAVTFSGDMSAAGAKGQKTPNLPYFTAVHDVPLPSIRQLTSPSEGSLWFALPKKEPDVPVETAVEHIFDARPVPLPDDHALSIESLERSDDRRHSLSGRLVSPDDDEFVLASIQYACNVPVATGLPTGSELFFNSNLLTTASEYFPTASSAFTSSQKPPRPGRNLRVSSHAAHQQLQPSHTQVNDQYYLSPAFLQEALSVETTDSALLGDVSSVGLSRPLVEPARRTKPSISKQRHLRKPDDVRAFLDESSSSDDQPTDAAQSEEEPWHVRSVPFVVPSVDSTAGSERPTTPPPAAASHGAHHWAAPTGATHPLPDKSRRASRFRSSTSSGANSVHQGTVRPLSPLVVDWGDDDADA